MNVKQRDDYKTSEEREELILNLENLSYRVYPLVQIKDHLQKALNTLEAWEDDLDELGQELKIC